MSCVASVGGVRPRRTRWTPSSGRAPAGRRPALTGAARASPCRERCAPCATRATRVQDVSPPLRIVGSGGHHRRRGRAANIGSGIPGLPAEAGPAIVGPHRPPSPRTYGAFVPWGHGRLPPAARGRGRARRDRGPAGRARGRGTPSGNGRRGDGGARRGLPCHGARVVPRDQGPDSAEGSRALAGRPMGRNGAPPPASRRTAGTPSPPPLPLLPPAAKPLTRKAFHVRRRRRW